MRDNLPFIHFRHPTKDTKMVSCPNCFVIFPDKGKEKVECAWCHEDVYPLPYIPED